MCAIWDPPHGVFVWEKGSCVVGICSHCSVVEKGDTWFFFFFLLRGNHVEIAHKMYVCLLELSLWFSESKPKSKLLILGLGFQAAMIGDLEVKR